MFKYYKGWRVLRLAAYAFILAAAVTNIAGGIGNGEKHQFHLGIAHILLVWMFVISDLRSMRGDSR